MNKKISNVNIENARIIFRNFSGVGDKFNAEGKRIFTLIIPEDFVEPMRADGWNVKEYIPKNNPEDVWFGLKVNVSYKVRAPRIYLICGKKKTLLDESTIGILDTAEIQNIDISVSPYSYEVGGRSGISAYVDTMYVTIEPDVFAHKYEDLD